MRGPPISSRRASASSRVRGNQFQARASLSEPTGPPSDEAPLSDSTSTRVRSSSPDRCSHSISRPTWASVCARNPAQVFEVLDGVGDQVLGEVVAVLVAAWWVHEVVVVHQGRNELVGLAAEEPVEALEAPAQRPAVTAWAQVQLLVP